MKTYALRCLAPDGEYITERDDFPTIETAWNRANDMGSRWFFYPVGVVTSTGPSAIIRDVPCGMPKEWIGKRFARLCAAFATDSQHACDYANGETPYCIYP